MNDEVKAPERIWVCRKDSIARIEIDNPPNCDTEYIRADLAVSPSVDARAAAEEILELSNVGGTLTTKEIEYIITNHISPPSSGPMPNDIHSNLGLFAVFYEGETRPVAGFVLEQDAQRYAKTYAGDATWEIRRVHVSSGSTMNQTEYLKYRMGQAFGGGMSQAIQIVERYRDEMRDRGKTEWLELQESGCLIKCEAADELLTQLRAASEATQPEQEKCEHGILMSMECVTCDKPEYVAAAQPDPQPSVNQCVEEVKRCVGGYCSTSDGSAAKAEIIAALEALVPERAEKEK